MNHTISQASTGLSGLSDWSLTKAASARGENMSLAKAARQTSRPVDRKRVLAISAVVISHTLLFGALMLPMKPIDRIIDGPIPIDTPWIEIDVPPPQPDPPEVKQIADSNPTPTEVRPAPMPTSRPEVFSAPALALASIESVIEAPITNIVTPPVDMGSAHGPGSALQVLRSPPPPYSDLRASGVLEFVVDIRADGSVEKIELLESTGSRRLDRTALQFIKRKWLFKAPEVNGIAQSGRGRGKVVFKLEG
jgi:periplasmic protein TonB